VTNAPLVVNDTLYVLNDDGDVTAMRGQPLGARAAQTAPAPTEPAAAPAGGG
jgi:hypothetical protein